MNQTANHPESHGPHGRDHLPRIPREQYPSIQSRRPVRIAGAEEGLRTFWAIYAPYAPQVQAPQSAEVARYQAQQEAAQRNLGANVVHQVATTPQYDVQPAAYYPNQTPNYDVQPAPYVQPVTPVAETNTAHEVGADQTTMDYLAQEVDAATADVAPVANMGDVQTDLGTLDYLAEQVDAATAGVDMPANEAGIDIEAVRRQIDREFA